VLGGTLRLTFGGLGGKFKRGVMKKAFVGLCIVVVLLVCSCATEEGYNRQKGPPIEVIGGGAVAVQAVGGRTGAAR
jgi:hypothetical protein